MKMGDYDVPILEGIKLYSKNEKVSGYPVFIGPHIFLFELDFEVNYKATVSITANRVRPGSLRQKITGDNKNA